MYNFMSICNKTENRRAISCINLKVSLKRNLTEPRTQWNSVKPVCKLNIMSLMTVMSEERNMLEVTMY
jgi:hypothetical protein